MAKKSIVADYGVTVRPQTSAPTDPQIGQMYYDSLAATQKVYTATGWINLGVPSGSVSAFAGTTPPAGWLLCNGDPINRVTYAALYTAIGTAHGYGDNSTTFNLPDYRGRFLRGVSGTSTVDPDKTGRTAMNTGGNTGNAVGSIQDTQLGSHNHSQPAHDHSITYGVYSNYASGTVYRQALGAPDNTEGGNTTSYFQGNRAMTSTSAAPSTNNTGGNETRPANAYVNYIIKV